MKRVFIRSDKAITRRTDVFKGMVTLAKGAVFARFLGLISIPILTRIYSPDDFGILAMYSALVAILAPILTMRYVQAIPLPKTDIIAINLFVVCLVLIFFGVLFTTFTLGLFGSTVLGWFNMQALVPWWPLIVLGVAGTALYELFSLWATRKKQYRVLATTQVTQSLLGNTAKVIFGLLGAGYIGLLVGQFIAQSGGIGSFYKQSYRDFKRLSLRVTKGRKKFVAKYYSDFPIYRLPSTFLMVVCLQAPVLMVASLYNAEVTGQLGLAVMAISLPVTLISTAVSKAYYAEISSLGKNNIQKIQQLTFRVQKRLFVIGLPVTLISMLAVVPAFGLVFGEAWATAGWYAMLLMPYMLFKFTSSPLEQVLNIISRQQVFLVINTCRLAGFLLLYFVARTVAMNHFVFVGVVGFYMVLYYLFMSGFIVLKLRRSAKTI